MLRLYIQAVQRRIFLLHTGMEAYMSILHKRNFLVILLILFCATSVIAIDFNFKPIVIEDLSRYNEDRIAYQHVQKQIDPNLDNSFSALLIIKQRKIYLIQDGYDNPAIVANNRLRLEMETKIVGDLWENKINNKPDYVRITDRKIELLKNFSEDFVAKNFGTFFINVRNALIKKHVEVFKKLMVDRKESGLIVTRTSLPLPAYLNAPETPTKYKTIVSGKTIDEKLYYAEDSDGDGITETFMVNSADGFNWGYKSGANIIFIYNNQDEEIKGMIGQLCNWAYFGTPEEEKEILQNFPKDSDIINEFKLEVPQQSK